jgi:D-xylose transport system permease protein
VQPIAFVGARAVLVGVIVLIGVVTLDADRGISSSLVFFLGLVVGIDYVHLRAARADDRVRPRVDRGGLGRHPGCFAGPLGQPVGRARCGAPECNRRGGCRRNQLVRRAWVGVGRAARNPRHPVDLQWDGSLLSLQPSIKFMITGAVLLAAVTIDAVFRRGRQASGR